MSAEFAEWLLVRPEAEQTGRVFHPMPRRVHGDRLGWQRVSVVICKIGRAAGVKVATHPTTGKVKYALAHDLRRSFGERWASRILPPDLMVLMRHESIDTTMKYYVGRNAQNTARVLWEAHEKAARGNIFGNTCQNTAETTDSQQTQTVN